MLAISTVVRQKSGKMGILYNLRGVAPIRTWLHAICVLDTSFLTPKKNLKPSVLFKLKWSLIYRLHCTWIPSVYKKKINMHMA